MPTSTPQILHVFSTFAPGGPQVRTVGLMAAFGDEFRHTVVPMDGCSDARDLLPADFPIVLEEQPRASGTFSMVRALRALFARRNPDLICTYNWGAIEAVMAARSMRRSVLHHEDGFLPDESAGFKPRRVWIRRLLLKGVRGLIVPSHTLENIALDLWRLPAKKVSWIPNGIEIPALADEAERRAARLQFELPIDDPSVVVIGAVGHLRGEKNYARLIRAFALLPVSDGSRPFLLLLGDGVERKALEQTARNSPAANRIVFAGHREDLRPAYAAMDIFAISSDTEQMPIALLEAMVAELPAVSTDVGDVRSMLPAEQAKLVVPIQQGEDRDRTAAALAEALEQLIANAEWRRSLGRSNRLRVQEQFAHEPMLGAYRKHYLGTSNK